MLTVMRRTTAVRSSKAIARAVVINRTPLGIAVAMINKQATPTTPAMTFRELRPIRASEMTDEFEVKAGNPLTVAGPVPKGHPRPSGQSAC
ncbi:hypothetical protein StoSoilB3_34660 [Arthrobacter sp. StoSoilB3]|nr:hypothetical protein StoSoilB3_34660 [Arthrobacter sp. StoSoilB3]